MLNRILEINGLSEDILLRFSYRTTLQSSLKKTLRHYDRNKLIEDILNYQQWISKQNALEEIALDLRIKSYSSIVQKYYRYYDSPKHANQVFNDILGMRAFCDDYNELMHTDSKYFRIVDMSLGKSIDDGYRGVHVYFQVDNYHYPIEIQFNTFYDRQINNWLHEYVYKRSYGNIIGLEMRKFYEMGRIHNIDEFEEVLSNVLSNS